MPYQAPPAVNYPSPLVMIRDQTQNVRVPPEGYQMVPVEIDWGSMGGADHCVNIDLKQNSTAGFSQICGLSVDNSDCAADIRFIFPDTGETTTIPAYAPKTIIQVFTNNVQFWVQSGLNGQTVSSTDATRFSIHNTPPQPIAVPVTEAQLFANAAAIATSVGTTAIVAAGKNGRLEAVDIMFQFPTSTDPAKTCTWQLVDGDGNVIATGTVGSTSLNSLNVPGVFRVTNMAVPFVNGLNFKITASTIAPDGTASVNIYYRSP